MLTRIVNFYRAMRIARQAVNTLVDIPQLASPEAYYRKHSAPSLGLADASSLDRGCGENPRNPFQMRTTHGIDIRESPEKNIRNADLTLEDIPFADASFDYVTAFDFIEHIPRIIYTPQRRFPFVELMNEVWRVLKPNGIFLSHTPIFPYSIAFRDPTDVNFITNETFTMYFDDTFRYGSMYGFRGAFDVRDQIICHPHLLSFLQKTSIP